MRRIFGIKFGGLQQKILNLVLIFLLALIGVFMLVSYYQIRRLNSVVGEARSEQQRAIERVSGETMYKTIESSLVKTNELQADNVNEIFTGVTENIRMLQGLAQTLFENKDSLLPAEFHVPDPSKDGTPDAQVLFEEGVRPESSEYLGIAAHMTDTMLSVFKSYEKVGGCFIGLADGTHIGIDTRGSDKYDENGVQIPYPVRERPWYRGAAETGDIFFTGVERDAFNNTAGITCSAPVIVNGRTVAVVGIDIVLDTLESVITSDDYSFVCIVNSSGQVVFSPKDTGLLAPETSDKAADLRNSALSGFINSALAENTGLTTVNIDGKNYYAVGSPLKMINWAVLSFVEKDITEQPTALMREEYDRINNNATVSYEKGTYYSKQTTLVMTAVLLILGSAAALFVAGRIVRPIESMTNDITEGGKTGKPFEMKDIYRTKDEIEVLAEAFDDLSKKARQYIIDITRITKEKERIDTELELARKIQADMLPNIYPAFPDRPEFDIYATMTPAKEVGGDFYDFFLIDDDHLGMVIADVSGKGVPAALFMMMVKILIKNYAMQGDSPAQALEQTNTAICQKNDEEMFVTVWFGIMQISTGRIIAANAGHEYPIIRRATGDYEVFKDVHGFVVGGLEGIKYKEYEMQLEKGGTLFIYTDGVPEATNADSKLFGTERLVTAMNKYENCDPVELLTNIKKEIDSFVGEADQFDDLTMLGVTRK